MGDKLCGCNGCNAVAFRMNVLGSRQSKKILEQIKEMIMPVLKSWEIRGHACQGLSTGLAQRKYLINGGDACCSYCW